MKLGLGLGFNKGIAGASAVDPALIAAFDLNNETWIEEIVGSLAASSVETDPAKYSGSIGMIVDLPGTLTEAKMRLDITDKDMSMYTGVEFDVYSYDIADLSYIQMMADSTGGDYSNSYYKSYAPGLLTSGAKITIQETWASLLKVNTPVNTDITRVRFRVVGTSAAVTPKVVFSNYRGYV